MIRPKDIEMEIEEGERYLGDDQLDLARAKLRLAASLLGRLTSQARAAGKVGGPLAGIVLADAVDGIMGGEEHSLLSVIIGGALGYAGGTKAAQTFDSAMSPLWVRIHVGLGDVAYRSGDITEARTQYATALRHMPDDPIVMQRMATVT